MLTPKDRSLVLRTLDLYERMALFRSAPSSFVADDTAVARIARWEKLFASVAVPGAFDRRLEFDGFDRTSVLPVLGRIDVNALPEDEAAPAWLAVLHDVRGAMGLADSADRLAPVHVDLVETVAFGHYWGPWLAVAQRLVQTPPFHSFSSDVQRELSNMLLRDLAQCGTQCLMHEFDLDRVARLSPNDLVFWHVKEVRGEATSAVGTERYRSFIEALHGPKADALFEKYPCLARLAATRVLFWVRHVRELASRLERDRPAIERAFGARGEVVGIECDLADSHNGGRRVAILRFATGPRIVYKPKDLGTERAFQALVESVNALGFSTPLKTLTVLERRGYGWVELVPTAPSEREDDLRKYYRRCGALVALVTLLRGADCHFENIIADGSQPVLVDHEVLLEPRTGADPESLSATDAIDERLEASALRTALLPQWTVGLDGTIVDVSGIGARPSPRTSSSIRMVHMNSDEMAAHRSAAVPDVQTNTPRSHSAGDFAREVLDGFEEVHSLLLALARAEGREALVELVAPFDGMESRHVVRGTVGYHLLARETRTPDAMGDGLDRALGLDRIARTFIGVERPAAWRVLEAEEAALLYGDIPSFVLRSNERAIFVRDREDTATLQKLGDDVFTEAGVDVVRRTLRTMTNEDTLLEAKLIEQSFSGKAAGIAVAKGTSALDAPPRDEDLPAFDDARAIEKAVAIAKRIAKSAVRWRGAHHHVGLAHDVQTGISRAALLGPDLYTGVSGIALFLGAAAHVAHDADLRAAVLTTLAATRSAVQRDPRLAMTSLGGFDGVGGIIYAWARLAVLLDEPSLVDDARSIANAIRRSDLAESPTSDVFSGTAGLLLALLALDATTGTKPGARGPSAALIESCARSVLTTARREAHGIGWPLRDGKRSLCGFSHGNAGIAVALLEAWRSGGSRDFRAAAEEALAYERSVRDDTAGNWPDLRDDGPSPSPPMSTWCNGAPGILLARSRVLAIDDIGAAREDFDLALRTTRAATSTAVHLCCGTAGIDEILYEVGLRNGDAALTEVARRRAMQIEIHEDGTAPRVLSHGFIRGSAGLGFLLLRMTAKGHELATVLDLSV